MSTHVKTTPPGSFADKAKDLGAMRDAVVDAAGVSAGLWISYLFVFFYLAVAAGGVTHKTLLFENPVKLPFLNVDLPLIGFFVLGPLLFLIVHAYVLLHLVLLAGKVGLFHAGLRSQIADASVRAGLRRQLPSNIFVQFVAGPDEVRRGFIGFILRLIAWLTLVVAPLALLVFFLFQFLPYHNVSVTWWQRFAVVTDLVLLWTLWPSVVRGETIGIRLGDLRRAGIAVAAVASLVPLLLIFTIATFPGELLNRSPLRVPIFPGTNPQDGSVRWLSPYQILVAGDINLIARRPTSLWSNVLVLPRLDIIDRAKFDTEAKIAALPETLSLRGRHLEGAILFDARLPKVDFTAAYLQDAVLDKSDLHESKFGCDYSVAVVKGPPTHPRCTQLTGAELRGTTLTGASLDGAELEGAQLDAAILDGASMKNARLGNASLKNAIIRNTELKGANFSFAFLDSADLSGSTLNDLDLRGASFRGARMEGVSLAAARLQGADFSEAQLAGAILVGAELQGANFASAEMQGVSLRRANLAGALFSSTQLQGASLSEAQLDGAAFINVFVWRTQVPAGTNIRVAGAETNAKYRQLDCGVPVCKWSQSSYDSLKYTLIRRIPQGERRDAALRRVAVLDPARQNREEDEISAGWSQLASLQVDEDSFAKSIYAAACGVVGEYPYIIHGMLGTLSHRFAPNSPTLVKLANAFLDVRNCPVASQLLVHDRALLRKIAESSDKPPAASATSEPRR